MVLYVLDNFLSERKLTGEDDMNCIARAFFVTAVRENPLVLSANDFTFQHIVLYTKLLRDILLEYKHSFERGYAQIMSREEHKR